MSKLQVDDIVNKEDNGSVGFSRGAVVTGVCTATSFSGTLTGGASGDFSIEDKIVHTSDTNTAIRFPAADTITAETGGTERLRITSAGKVGIGTVDPGSPLEVSGGTALDTATFNSHHANGTLINLQRDGTSKGFLGSGKNIADATGGVDDIGLRANANLIFASGGGTERVRISSNGNVGIGTDSPQTQLHLRKADPIIRFEDTAAPTGYSQISATQEGALILSADESNSVADSHLRFKVDNSERMRITGIGSVGIGDNDPHARFQVKGNTEIDNEVVFIENHGIGGGQSGRSSGIAVTSVSNNSASECYGVYIYAKQGVGGDTYGLRAQAEQTSSSTAGIGVLGHTHVNSGATNHSPSLPTGGVCAGVYGFATTYGSSNIAQTAGVVGWNDTQYGSLSYGGYFRTKAGPTTIIPLLVNHDGTDLLKVKSDRNVEICDGNLVVGNGYGINFHPQGGSDVNKLDDYEEGTWTPSIGGNATYSDQSGTYVKVGRMVYATGILGINNKGTGSSIGRIQGLPFPSGVASQNTSNLTWSSVNVNFAYGVYYVGNGDNVLNFSYTTGSQSGVSNNPDIWQNGTSVTFSITYYANS